jgi:hypothetical protein
MSNSNTQSNYYGLILILSIIGTILFTFTDFGGYLGYYRYSISLESSFNNPDLIAFAPLYILVVCLFLLNIFIPLKELKIIKTSFPKNSAKLGFYSSLLILIISAFGAIAMEVILSEADAVDWWLDAGFYAGIIGGILLPLLYYFTMKKPTSKTLQTTYPPPPPPPPQNLNSS